MVRSNNFKVSHIMGLTLDIFMNLGKSIKDYNIELFERQPKFLKKVCFSFSFNSLMSYLSFLWYFDEFAQCEGLSILP